MKGLSGCATLSLALPARGRMRAVGVRSCGRMRAAAGGSVRWRRVRAAIWWTALVRYHGVHARRAWRTPPSSLFASLRVGRGTFGAYDTHRPPGPERRHPPTKRRASCKTADSLFSDARLKQRTARHAHAEMGATWGPAEVERPTLRHSMIHARVTWSP